MSKGRKNASYKLAGIENLKNNDKDKYEYQIERELNIKKIVIICGICVTIILLVLLISCYIAKREFRNWVDINVLRKSITNEDVVTIDLEIDKNNQIYCYNKYICILKDKVLSIYTQGGDKINEISVDVNTAIFSSNEKYLVIAEKEGNNFLVISEKNYLWKESVDGKILQISINKNGYVAVVTTDTTYKSIITLYNQQGKQQFRNYLSTTRVEDIVISNDNKYVSFSELDTSGTLIQSNIKIISVQNAKEGSQDAIIYTYNSDVSKLIIKLKYQDNGDLIALYDDEIMKINIDKVESIEKIENKISFASVNLKNSVAYIEEENTGFLNNSSVLTIKNTQNKQISKFNIDGVAKEMYTNGSVIGINIGTEMYFVNTNGMLIKKYKNNQEITNVIISEELAIITYKDRIEIIKT